MTRLLRLAASARGPLALTAAAIVAAAAATIAHTVLAAGIIAGAFIETADVSAGDAPDTPGRWFGSMETALLALLAFILVRALAVGLAEGAAQRIATRVKSYLRVAMVAGMINDGRALSSEQTGELVTTAVDGVEKLDAFYRRFVPQAMTTAVVPVMIVVAVAFIDPLSAALLAITGPLIPLFMWLLGTMAQQRAREQWVALSLLGGRFLDTLQGLPTLTIFGRAPEAALALEDASEELRHRTMGVLRVAFLSGLVLELAASVSTAVVAASIGVRLVEGWMTFETGLAVLLLTPEFYLPFRQLGQRHHAAMEGTAAAERIFHMIDRTGDASGGAAQTTSAVASGRCTLAIVQLTHAYTGADRRALDRVSATFAPLTLTAVVGESGAGKSTLLHALLRLIEPTAGQMYLNGRAHTTFPAAAWRRHFAFVPQRPRFLHASIADNLRMACADATNADLVEAVRMAHADGFVEALPDKYDTVIDETASTLSGGERQRLAIARALLKGAPILVLDEPTSSVDAGTEAALNDTLMRIRQDRTVIVVTHRLDITRRADQVVTLAGGGRVTDTRRREVA